MIFNAFRDTSDSLLNSFEISPLATMNVKKNSIAFSVLASFKVLFIKLDPSILITFTNIRNMKIWILGYIFYKIVILCSKREHCMFLFTDRFTCIDGCGHAGVRSDASIVYCMDMVNRRTAPSHHHGFIPLHLSRCSRLLYSAPSFKGSHLHIYIPIIPLIV